MTQIRTLAAAVVLVSTSAHAENRRIDPGPDAPYRLQEALIAARPGDVIELGSGVFRLSAELSATADHLTIRGQGIDETILSFAGQQVGSQGLIATGDAFVIEDLAIEDTAGNAIKVLGSDGVVFRRVRTEWTGGPDPGNGAYGIYPVQCRNVLIDECVAIGASDAGIYVGQSDLVLVRDSRAELNVAGIEIENTTNAEVVGCTSTRNTGGILVFDLPGLQVVNGGDVLVRGNRVYDNNTPNFAPPGNIVGTVPPGTGVMILATDRVEVVDNDIRDHGTVNVAVISHQTVGRRIDDDRFDPFPEEIHVHGNRIANGGYAPAGEFGDLLGRFLPRPLADILFDGVLSPAADGDAGRVLRFADNGEADFANFRMADVSPKNLLTGKYRPSFDPAPHVGAFPAIAAIDLDDFPELDADTLDRASPYADVPDRLSDWPIFAAIVGSAADGLTVLPYELNTPLFADHTVKHRHIHLPGDAPMTWTDTGTLDFPVGTVISKRFAYPIDAREPRQGERFLETRLEVRSDDGWTGWSYLWNEAQTDAMLALGGASIDTEWIDADGVRHEHRYEVPNVHQCLSCHEQGDAFQPLGPTAANLNRPGRDRTVVANQLEAWVEAGHLVNAPSPEGRPCLPTWNDPATGDLDARARAWLDVNCAHCHNPIGTARTSGLDLRRVQHDPAKFGVFKSPVASGRGSGGRRFDIAPGDPDGSILLYRVASDEPAIRMPSLSRHLVDDEAVALLRAWIAAMPTEDAGDDVDQSTSR